MKRTFTFRLFTGLSLVAFVVGGYLMACSKSGTPAREHTPNIKKSDTAKERVQGKRIVDKNQIVQSKAAVRYEVLASVPDAGTINGVVKYAGERTDGTVTIVKDSQVCEHHKTKEIRPEGAILVQDGNLENVVVYLSNISRGLKAPATDITIDNIECTFVPRVQVGFVGGRVVAKNSDDTLHNTHLFLANPDDTRDLKNMALPKAGQTRKFKMKYAGLHDVKCDAHNWMQGWVFSSKHPYIAVSGADGSFKMENVPAGTWAVKAWHEKFGEKDGEITVTAGGTATLELSYN
jgi:plastocyanin